MCHMISDRTRFHLLTFFHFILPFNVQMFFLFVFLLLLSSITSWPVYKLVAYISNRHIVIWRAVHWNNNIWTIVHDCFCNAINCWLSMFTVKIYKLQSFYRMSLRYSNKEKTEIAKTMNKINKICPRKCKYFG